MGRVRPFSGRLQYLTPGYALLRRVLVGGYEALQRHIPGYVRGIYRVMHGYVPSPRKPLQLAVIWVL